MLVRMVHILRASIGRSFVLLEVAHVAAVSSALT